MPFVLDASIVLAWQFADESSEYADRVVAGLRDDQGIVPSIWLLEVANGFLAAERRRRITPAEVLVAVGECLELPLSLREVDREDLGRILDLARDHQLSVYDAAYLDLAMRETLPLATLDRDLLLAAARAGVTTLL